MNANAFQQKPANRGRNQANKSKRPGGPRSGKPKKHGKKRGGRPGGRPQSGGRSNRPQDRFRRKPGKPAGPRYRVASPTAQEAKKIPPVAPGKLRIFSLGGLEDVGERNMQVLEYGDDIITIDCGFWFGDANVMPGIDYVVPDSTYLQQNAKRIRGMLMCHSHLDHIGGLPHVAPLIGFPPIYCTPLTKAILERRQEEFGNKGKFRVNTFKPKDVIQLGVFKIEVFHINHNVPEAVGFAIHTPVGTIVHSGDFKFDLSPTYGEPADVGHIAQIGDRGILALMSDSTDAGFDGHQLSESDVLKSLDDLLKNVKGRIIAVTFASLLMRIQMLVDLAEKYDRKIIIEGFSMKANTEIAQRLKAFRIKPNTLIDAKQINQYPDERILVIGTGAQAEEFAMLTRMSRGEHQRIKLKRGDTVLFSSSVIPGNEKGIEALKDNLYRAGADVIHYHLLDVHAGGHGKNEDIKLMFRLVRPKYLMPIHAGFFRRVEAARLGEKAGIPMSNSLLIENGDIVEFDKDGKAEFNNLKVPTNKVMIDGLGEGDVSHVVMRDRLDLAEEGIVIVIATTDDHGTLVREPDIITRGFVAAKDSKEITTLMQDKVKEMMAEDSKTAEVNIDFLKTRLRNNLAQFIWNKTERRPMVLPIIVRA